MTGNLLVTPEKLITASQEFSNYATQVNNLTQQMTQIVTGLQSTWAGEANTAFTTKFNQLQDDMTRMHKMITEHSTDLQEMARNYQQAEQANIQTSGSLSGDVIS